MKDCRYSEEQWIAYINGSIDHPQRGEYESHLYTCDYCLDLFTTAIETEHTELPSLESPPDFSGGFTIPFEEIQSRPVQRKRTAYPYRRKFYEKAWFHYGIAAAATILLMFSGVFQQLAGIVSAVDQIERKGSATSITENIMEKTLSILDDFETEQKESER